ncbi:MAG: Nif3-like dinuclear metal center hexameric protein [Coriobacteriia bacterium]|nr:Nif3-like dinuclear metal center hexameric protein [Coriobacteriia bacterium]
MARFCVGDIEALLFAAFPATDALEDDRFGLLVGDRKTIVSRVAVSLDQTIPMIEAAAAQSCNLLVSHHPAFWMAPDSFLAADSAAVSSGAVVLRAAQRGVALLCLHTCLDCAPAAASMLLEPVGLEFALPLRAHGTGSLGQIARPAKGREFITLGELAASYQQSFGGVAKVWGDPAKPVFTVATCSGGASEVVSEVIAAGVDCFVTGELRHHEALYLSDSNIALIELGHDLSELPYRYYLRESLVTGGFPASDIVVLEPSATWWQPGSE